MYTVRVYKIKWPNGPVPCDKAPEVPLQEGCDPVLRITGKLGVGPQLGLSSEMCSRKTCKPNDFRLNQLDPPHPTRTFVLPMLMASAILVCSKYLVR